MVGAVDPADCLADSEGRQRLRVKGGKAFGELSGVIVAHAELMKNRDKTVSELWNRIHSSAPQLSRRLPFGRGLNG